jgi:hypothetical protein
MRNIDWTAVAERMAAVRADRPLPPEAVGQEPALDVRRGARLPPRGG